MGPGFGRGIEGAVMAMIVMVAVAAFAFGALAIWLLPKLWQLVRPWLRAVTA